MNTPDEEAHIDFILTREEFINWLGRLSRPAFDELLLKKFNEDKKVFEKAYLKDVGLPTDSIIKGL